MKYKVLREYFPKKDLGFSVVSKLQNIQPGVVEAEDEGRFYANKVYKISVKSVDA